MADTPSLPQHGEPAPVMVARIAADEGSNLSLGKQLLRPRTLISFAISFAIIAYIFAQQDIPFAQVWTNMRQANPLLYLLGLLAYYSTFIVRTFRWKQVLSNVGYERETPPTPTLVRIILLSWFANSVLPAKLGDGYRGFLLKRNADVSFSKTMGTILAERIADVGALFSLLLVSGLLAFRDKLPPNFGTLIAFGAGLAILSMSGLFVLRYIGPWVARVLPVRVRPYYERMEEGVLLAYRRRPASIFVLTAMIWILESTRLWFVCAALGVGFALPGDLPLVIFIALAASLL
ncbi:MAG: flippase-like domain-containing protein, partial [Chloroflexota bacterium]|nr:flippase-like domain-containing protein [Chloroflexota bacterium]